MSQRTTGGDAKKITDCPTCQGKKKTDQVSCLECWQLVPYQLQVKIYRLFEQQRGSQSHLDAIQEGVEAIEAAKKEE